jgi:hypothetical protein
MKKISSRTIGIASTLLLSVFASQAVLAATVTWTEMPASSTTWNTDPYFGALSNNPWDIFSGSTSVEFVGYSHPGGSKAMLTGFGDNSGNSVMRLLDARSNVISTQALTGYNQLATTVLQAGPGAVGKVFYYEEYDSSTDGRYRTFLTVSFTPL